METITAAQLQLLLKEQPDLFLIDVREPIEHEDFNIGGQLMPLGELMQHANDIPKDKPVVVYCHHGVRSVIAIQKLEAKLGFSNLINLQGGTHAWEIELNKTSTA